MTVRFAAFLILISFTVTGWCDDQSVTESGHKAIEQDNHEQYEAIVERFISSALAGNLDKMVELTSDVTIDQIGLDNLKAHYQNDTIPFFNRCKHVSVGGEVVPVTKEQSKTGSGFLYIKSCHDDGNNKVKFQIAVLNESGKIAVTYFSLAQ